VRTQLFGSFCSWTNWFCLCDLGDKAERANTSVAFGRRFQYCQRKDRYSGKISLLFLFRMGCFGFGA
jgi:hypothetical protein